MSSSLLGPHNAHKLLDISYGLQAPNDVGDINTVLDDSGEADDDDRLLRALALLRLLSKQTVKKETTSHEINQLVCLIGLRYLSKLRPQELLQGSKQNLQVAATAELSLACLYSLVSWQSFSLGTETLFYVTAYTKPSDPWTTQEAASLANMLIDTCLSQDQIRRYIVEDILPRWIRPSFSGTTSKVSHSGRPSRFPEQAACDTRPPGAPAPWKQTGLQIISTVRWVVHNTDETLIRDNWPLFTPVLLTMSDDQDTAIRRTGLEITTNFLEKCPAKVLKPTGIGDVFEDTILPSVLYLPSLTPPEESVKIMGAAYEALQVLVEKELDVASSTRRALLDRIFRDGVFPAYEHASDYPVVVEALMSTTAVLLDKLGIFAVKHFPKLLSAISSVLTDPFAALHPGLIVQTTIALKALIANCWPRVVQGGYAEELTRLIAICWLNVTDEASSVHSAALDVKQLEREFKQTQAMLRSLGEGVGAYEPDGIQEVIRKEPRLSNILSSS